MDGVGQARRLRRRLIATAAMLGLAALAVVGRLVQLAVVVPLQEPASPLVLPEVQRGAILDRRGRLLAITTRYRLASAWAPDIIDAGATARELAAALGMDARALQEGWRAHPGYSIAKRRLTDAEVAAIERQKANGRLAGIRVEERYGREYPEGRLASQLIGYVGLDNVGLDGIEFSFNDQLSPQPVGTDPRTVYGDQLYLTIDVTIQHRVEEVAREAMRANRADSISVLVADAHTAEVLAWVSLPDFDPNDLQRPSARVDPTALNRRPATMAYEPGSVFKVFSIASLLELGTITPASRFTCNGYYERKLPDGSSIRIDCVRAHGVVGPQQILEYSCNAGVGYAADTADNASFAGMLARFGFGSTTGVPLPGETAGSLAPPASWSLRSKATIAFGQEVSVSALQIVAAATVIANHGMLLRPTVVSKIVAPDGQAVQEYGRTERWRAVSATTADEVLAMLESATSEEGTARRAAIEGLRISAKTGTAQTTDPATGKYSKTDFTASILGIFPTDDPRLIVYVVIQNPRGESYLGSTIAAPVLRSVALELCDAMGIPRAGAASVSHPGAVSVTVPPALAVGERMPDLRGAAKKQLLALLLREDLIVELRGSGFVVRQEPAPGTPLEPGTHIVLDLQ